MDVDLYGPYCLLALQQQVATERGQCGQAKIDAAQ